MGVIEQQIAKAERRADFDVAAAARDIRDLTPRELAPPAAKDDRRDFLAASLGDTGQADRVLERILDGNELQPVNYLERGAIAARAVARIAIRSARGRGWGTGFLIAPRVLLTNHHVLEDMDSARQSRAEFLYELGLDDAPSPSVLFELDPATLFETSPQLDFTAVAVRPRSLDGGTAVESFGFLPLLETVGKAFEGEWLTIVQHPNGEPKQLCVRENRLIKREGDVLWYSTDTLAGSSGSAVFNNDWFVVALHHSGIPEKRDGRIRTVDGRDYRPGDPETAIKWVANEGIRASRIAETLRQRRPDNPLLRPMYTATAESARIRARPGGPSQPSAPRPSREAMPMPASFPLDITLRVEADGTARLLGPAARESALDGGAGPAAALERAAQPKPPPFALPFDADYAGRKGYRPDFLGTGAPVDLPALSPLLQAAAAPLLQPKEGRPPYVLDYHNFSVVMHAKRRLAIYSAANVDFAGRYDMSRPTDEWRLDPRIRAEHQLENWYYARNNFDRGHLTRREDLEYGPTPRAALESAADTCHWSNCTPQHSGFNQNKQIWQGIERYILETTILSGRALKAQIITGPVLDGGDPEYKGVQYPLQFWKVVAALDDAGKLSATAYLASQGEVIAQRGIEAAPFGAYGTFQVPVTEIERLTTLRFTSAGKPLSAHDPLSAKPAGRRRTLRPQESAFADVPDSYRSLGSLDDITV